MRDHYNTGQAGAVGPGAVNVSYQQAWVQCSGGIDLPTLERELDRLRMAMKASGATTPEQDEATGAIAAAQRAAAAGDGPRVLEHLKRAGKWAWETANKVGVAVAAKAIETALGLQ